MYPGDDKKSRSQWTAPARENIYSRSCTPGSRSVEIADRGVEENCSESYDNLAITERNREEALRILSRRRVGRETRITVLNQLDGDKPRLRPRS